MGRAVNEQTVLVIVNPTSPKVPKGDTLEEMLEPLRREGHRFEIAATKEAGDATRIAAQADPAEFTRIAACGGDGTLNEVINGMVDSSPPLGLLPAGTGNVFAKEAKIPWNIPAAARLLVEGEPRRLDLGSANGRRFLLMCGIGFDGTVTAKVRGRLKRRLGSTAFFVIGLPELVRFKAPRAVFDLDGEKLEREFFMAQVGNSRSWGGVLNITKRAFLDDGLLDVCIPSGGSLIRLSRHAVRVVLGSHMNASDVVYRRVRRLGIEQPGIALQMDGEPFGQTPVIIESVPSALEFVLPEKADYLFAHPDG
jgi:diacylglycerol kinase (ATP)